jgi:hypothetical protein
MTGPDRNRTGTSATNRCERAAPRPRTAALHCPRCRLMLTLRTPWMQPRVCPRCLAYARITVRLVPAHHNPSRPQPGGPSLATHAGHRREP